MTSSSPQPWRVAAAGMVALAVAMGIGRFAFTPILPMMLADGVVNLPVASLLASANYLGYMVGALLCSVQPWLWQRWGRPPLSVTRLVRAGLVLTCLLTLAMAPHWPQAWPLLRFAAGVASALVFVATSAWCLGQLSRLGMPAMGAVIYTGPGVGIVLSGLAAMLMMADHWTAQAAWVSFGLLAVALAALVWPTIRPAPAPPTPPTPAGSRTAGARQPHGRWEVAWLTLAYGLAGFGYIVTATFLPVIARQTLPGSAWLDLFWPLFGAGVIAGAWLASRLRAPVDMRLLLAACYAVQALGIALGLWLPSLTGFALGSLLLGLPFTAISFFAMQEARRIRPGASAALIGLLTGVYGLGQVAGPQMTAAILARSASAAEGFNLALEIAASALMLGALIYVGMTRAYAAR